MFEYSLTISLLGWLKPLDKILLSIYGDDVNYIGVVAVGTIMLLKMIIMLMLVMKMLKVVMLLVIVVRLWLVVMSVVTAGPELGGGLGV